MKTLISTLFLGGALIFNSYSQTTEKTKDVFKQYNEKGQLIREVYGNLLIGRAFKDFKYDEKGNKIEENYKEDNNGDGKFEYQVINKYDENGNKIGMISKYDSDLDGKFDHLVREKYDENGNLIERIPKRGKIKDD